VRIFFALFFSILLFKTMVYSAESSDLIFLNNGVNLKSLSLSSLKALQKDEVLKVFEPHENSQKEYRGFAVLPLVETIYGKNLKALSDTLVFYCTDGYRSDVPLHEFTKKKATLSFAMADGSPFILKKGTSVPLGPFYLTWDHPNAASAKKNFFRWPYGIQKIDLIESANAYKALVPQADRLQSLHRGHQEFLKHCFSCHTLNGVGGLRGPPLNYFVHTKSSSELTKYILNPRAFNINSQMAGLPKDLIDREKTAAKIVNYLKKQAVK
jgi:mono/diheme cytochrome c family protein